MVTASWRDGARRVLAAPAIVAGVFVVTFLLPVPLALAMRESIQAHLGASVAAREAAAGVNYDWWQEFLSQASGLAGTFRPSIIGFASTLDNVSSVVDRQWEALPVMAGVAVYALAWMFLTGGILDRYARRRPTRAHAFFAASGVHFVRFLRLAAVSALVYGWLFFNVHEWLFGDLYEALTRDVAVEREAFSWRAGMYLVFGLALVAVNLVLDYARIRIVVEDRRSAIGALLAATRFVLRHPGRTLGLYALNALVFVAILAAWALAAPGVPGAGPPMWAAFALGQVYLLLRLAVRLQFLASQTALFQASLAHAAYTAAPLPAWPESPTVESLGRMRRVE